MWYIKILISIYFYINNFLRSVKCLSAYEKNDPKTNCKQISKSRKIKITGQIILLLSFLTQTLLFDYYNVKSNSLEKAYTNQSLIDKGAELKEIKYFVASFPIDTATTLDYQRLNINLAAQKIAQSQMMAIIGSGKSKKEQIDISNLLIQKAMTVNNFTDYMEFIDFVNKYSIQTTEIITNIDNINSSKKLWRFIFTSFYLLGTCLLIYSIRFEND